MRSIFGRHYLADLGNLVVRLHFTSETSLTFTIVNGGGLAEDGYTETVTTAMSAVRPGVYFTTWTEKSGAHVTHLEDFAGGTLRSVASLPDGRTAVMNGTLKPLDGSAVVDDRKAIARRAMHELFENGDLSALDRYWSEPYAQHNPQMPDGLDGIRAIVPTLKNFSWQPQRMVEEGDLVMAHSRVLGWGPEPVVIVDIFRFEGDRIVEHWDVVQPEVPAARTASGRPMV